jgi:hypothetical protein
MCRKRYYSNNPYDTIIQATTEFLDFWLWFEDRMRFKFTIDGIPHIKLRSNDFNRIKDYLSEKCKKLNTGFLIEIPQGKVWVDYSEPFGKEANYPEAQEILEKVTKDHLLNKPMLNSELQGRLSEMLLVQERLIQTQTMNNQNIIKHQKVLDEMLKTLKKIQGKLNGN